MCTYKVAWFHAGAIAQTMSCYIVVLIHATTTCALGLGGRRCPLAYMRKKVGGVGLLPVGFVNFIGFVTD